MSSTTTNQATALPDQLRGVVERAAVAELLDRFIVALDDHKFDDDAWLRALVTDDVRFEFPLGAHDGVDGLAAFLKEPVSMFERTHHLNSKAVVDIEGDQATMKANMIATHVNPPNHGGNGEDPGLLTTFGTHMDGEPRRIILIGTHMDGEARRGSDGWRLQRLTFRLAWLMGDPPPKKA
jgi:hypothetical protein